MLKDKGIKDLYLIKNARIGSRNEGQANSDPNDLRLVFELQYVTQPFKEYEPVKLEIWHTYKDTTMDKLLSIRYGNL